MSDEGYGCLYLPSIAPQTTPSQAVVAVGMATGSDANIISGIGSGMYYLCSMKTSKSSKKNLLNRHKYFICTCIARLLVIRVKS